MSETSDSIVNVAMSARTSDSSDNLPASSPGNGKRRRYVTQKFSKEDEEVPSEFPQHQIDSLA